MEAILVLGAARDATARDRLTPFLAIDRLTVEQRRDLLNGGAASGEDGDGGGEICACFGVSCGAVATAITGGARSLDAVGQATRAGTNCGSCRPELRALLRAARLKQAA